MLEIWKCIEINDLRKHFQKVFLVMLEMHRWDDLTLGFVETFNISRRVFWKCWKSGNKALNRLSFPAQRAPCEECIFRAGRL